MKTSYQIPLINRLAKVTNDPVVQGAVLLTAVALVLINLATDLVYKVLDPRVRLS